MPAMISGTAGLKFFGLIDVPLSSSSSSSLIILDATVGMISSSSRLETRSRENMLPLLAPQVKEQSGLSCMQVTRHTLKIMDDGLLTQQVVYGWPTLMKRPTRGESGDATKLRVTVKANKNIMRRLTWSACVRRLSPVTAPRLRYASRREGQPPRSSRVKYARGLQPRVRA